MVVIAVVLLGVCFMGAGVVKLAGLEAMRADAKRFGFSYRAYRMIGALEVCGGASLIGGLAFTPLAIIAATGLVGLIIGAVVCHVRAGDPVVKPAAAVIVGLLTAIAGVASVVQ
ncbi:DoxX family protein [Nocardia brevicatena]|uniref:DoxX family protein n=1 Tax=Nocardia brevicatena TaxID=37327 RepID=UPI000306DFAA|nr:DoxX family protein [Nocardia brevicatena]